MARVSKQTQDAIIELIAYGVPREVAARAHSIPYQTLSKWLTGDAPAHRTFQRRLDEATARCEVDLVEKVQRYAAGPQGYKAAIWLLEHRFPERWGENADEDESGEPQADPLAGVDELASRRANRSG